MDRPPRFGTRLFESRARGGMSTRPGHPAPTPRRSHINKKEARPIRVEPLYKDMFRRCPALPRGLPRSTIGAEELNFRVRNGTGCFPFAIAAGNPMELFGLPGRSSRATQWTRTRQSAVQVVRVVSSPRPVSTGQLSTLPCLHFRPINPVVWLGALPHQVGGRPHLEACFPLRCFQRLSLPDVANQPCSWRNNWHTRGQSVPVLSY